MSEGKFKIKITFDPQDVLNKMKLLRTNFEQAIVLSIEKTAEVLLRDCRPYIPMLTGRLRDSGHVEDFKRALNNYAFKVVWDAANPATSYIYAAKQHDEILQHVDGRYAAKWVDNVLKNNPDRYVMLCARFLNIALSRTLNPAPVAEGE